VRRLLSSGSVPAISALPDSLQSELTVQQARMSPVHHNTVNAVAAEIANPSSLVRLRSNSDCHGDPWGKTGNVENERLAQVLEDEAIEVAAIALSKRKDSRAAELLGLLCQGTKPAASPTRCPPLVQ
jgi:flagellar motor switch protein FliG